MITACDTNCLSDRHGTNYGTRDRRTPCPYHWAMPLPHSIATDFLASQDTQPCVSLTALRGHEKRHWLRNAWLLVLLCFTLGTLAHSGHLHMPGKSTPGQSTHEQCDLCVGFGATMAPPVTELAVFAPVVVDALIIAADSIALSRRPAGLPQARAPPHSC